MMQDDRKAYRKRCIHGQNQMKKQNTSLIQKEVRFIASDALWMSLSCIKENPSIWVQDSMTSRIYHEQVERMSSRQSREPIVHSYVKWWRYEGSKRSILSGGTSISEGIVIVRVSEIISRGFHSFVEFYFLSRYLSAIPGNVTRSIRGRSGQNISFILSQNRCLAP